MKIFINTLSEKDIEYFKNSFMRMDKDYTGEIKVAQL